MGRMLKNTVFKTAGHALGVPTGTSSVGPDVPQNGQTRYNTTTGRLEFYANMTGTPSWNAIAREGNVTLSVDSFTGTGSATDFSPMKAIYASGKEAQVLVHVGGVYQIPTTNYTFNGTSTIHFVSAPSDGAAITIIHGIGSTISTLA